MGELLKIEKMKLKDKKLNMLGLGISLIPWMLSSILVFSVFKGEDMKLKVISIFNISSNMFIGFLLPIFIIYFAFILGREEHLNGGWKLLFTYPVNKGYVYFSKLIILIGAVIKFVIVFVIITIMSNIYIGIDMKDIISTSLVMFSSIIGYLPFIIVVFLLSMKFPTVGVPITTGMVLTVLDITIINSEKLSNFLPTCYGIKMFYNDNFYNNLFMIIVSLVIFILFLFIIYKKSQESNMV